MRAAVADPAAAQAVASGRLTKTLAYAGFGEVDLTAATATPLTGHRRAKPPTGGSPEESPERAAREAAGEEAPEDGRPAVARTREGFRVAG